MVGVWYRREAFVEEGRREGVRCPEKVMREPYNDVCENVVGVVKPREEGEIGYVGDEEQDAEKRPGYEERVTRSLSKCET